MSTTKVQMPVKIDSPEEKLVESEQQKGIYIKTTSCNTTNNNVPKKHKHDSEGRKFTRKRAYSFTPSSWKLHSPYKRRCNYDMCPPTKFLLGGNIHDPLNLNSLKDERINREMNAVTPKSSPLPTPGHRLGRIEVIIPQNLHDPLNLMVDDEEYEQNLISPVKKGRKKNRKKKRNSLSGCSSKENSMEGQATEVVEDEKLVEEAPAMDTSTESLPAVSCAESTPKAEAGANRSLDLPLKKDAVKEKPRKCSVKDKIVSPVVPQPRVWMRPHGHRPNNKHHQKAPPNSNLPNFKKKNAKYQYGNYNRYYGYRNQYQEVDIRLKIFFEKRSLFQDKDILDIGCNIGHITLSIARDLNARSVLGLDIDQQLINIARKNVRHYVNFKDSPMGPDSSSPIKPTFYPISMPIVYGPVDVPGVSESPSTRKKFPHNVTFVQGNYVIDSDTLLSTDQAQFDVILCLSITKWIHMNWGDAGLKQAFRRMFAQLRPGGRLILEAQGWDSYKKRKTLTETIYKNYHEIRFFPQKFTEFLLSEVGFITCEVLATPCHPSKGFQRPIQMFTKGSFSSTYSAPSTPFYQPSLGWVKAPVYTPVVISSRSVDEDETFEPLETGGSSRVSEENQDAAEEEAVCVIESHERELDSFQGVVCVADGNELSEDARTADVEESASVSSLVTDASQTETQDSV